MSFLSSKNEHQYPFVIGNIKLPYVFVPYYNPNKFEITTQKEFNRTQTIGGQVFEHWGKQPPVIRCEMLMLKNGNLGGLINRYNNAQFDDPMFSSELDGLQRMFELDQRYLKNLWSSLSSLNPLKKNEKVSNTLNINTSNGLVTTVENKPKSGTLDSALTTSSNEFVVIKSDKPKLEFLSKLPDTFIYYKLNIYSGFFTKFQVVEDGKEPFTNRVVFEFLVTGSISDLLNQMLATTNIGRSLIAAGGTVSAITAFSDIASSVSSGITDLIKVQ